MDRKLYKEVGLLRDKWKDYGDYVDKSDPNNRKALIEKNLRLAIEIALRYKDKGLDEDELISSAFFGLANAYDKYKENNPRNTQYKILQEIKYYTKRDDFEKLLYDNCKYGNVMQKYMENKTSLHTPTDFRKFVKTYVKPAKFSSIAYFWIMAQIRKDIAETKEFETPDESLPYVEYPDFEEEYSLLFEGIAEDEENALRMRNLGSTYKEIGDEIGVSQREAKEMVDSAMKRIRQNAEDYNLTIGDFLI